MKKFLFFFAFLIMMSSSHASQAEEKLMEGIPEYRLVVSFDIPASRITGSASTSVEAGKKLILRTGRLTDLRMSMKGREIGFTKKGDVVEVTPPEAGMLDITYRGVFSGQDAEETMNYGVVSSVIGGRGISLTGTWYPQREGLCLYRLTAALPKGYEAVSEAEDILKAVKNGGVEFTFSFPHPLEGISLVASDRYEVTNETVNGIVVYAYFFSEDRGLAGTYLGHAKKYLDLYGKLLAPYAYKRFSVVENFLPSGYSMPTFTLLGQDVVRLPFIVETSLGHEILHQWFGNLLYIDYDKGNWAEGLTVYLADEYYEEQKGAGWEYRKQILIDYESYVNEKNEFPLRDFRSRTDFASRAIGYGKAAQVFHMLKNIMGEENFYRMLKDMLVEKRFQRVSWEDFRKESEKISHRDLGWFFTQWLDEKGIPDLDVEDLSLRLNGDKFEVRFTLNQKSRAYKLVLPVTITYLSGGSRTESLTIEKEKESFTFLYNRMPATMVIDKNYDVLRRLGAQEFPPVMARMIGDEKPLVVLPPSGKESYAAVIEYFTRKGADRREASGVTYADEKASTLVILGRDNPVIGRLFGRVDTGDGGFSVVLRQNPWNAQKVVGIVNAKSADETDAAFPKIFHYGKYSSLAFEGGRNISKKIDESERGMQMGLREDAAAVDVSALKTLSNAIEAAASKKIVYVGEYHDRFSNHAVELRVIRELFGKNKKLAIGMEMFQRPFQQFLDEYIAGTIDEREFLKKSEYFKRWVFDYNLYKPILDFARQEKIPVIALNMRREITDKVAAGGLDSLTEEERKEIPARMDFSDLDYRERLKSVFEQHEAQEGLKTNFDFFFQVQILWDETMAQSVDEYLKKNPYRQMIVLAGSGHLMYGAGIPTRAHRRNGLDYTIILNDADIDQDIANYVVFPQSLDGVTAPKLMVLLKEEAGKLKITGFAKGSVLQQAGLRAGDTLLSLDNTPVSSVEDVRLVLFYKKSGETLRVRASRKRFLLGEKMMEFEVKL